MNEQVANFGHCLNFEALCFAFKFYYQHFLSYLIWSIRAKIDEELQTFAVRIGMSGVKTEGFLGPVVYASATTFGIEQHYRNGCITIC